jgi:hypothetical protein
MAIRLGEARIPFHVDHRVDLFSLRVREADFEAASKLLGDLLGLIEDPDFAEGRYAFCPACHVELSGGPQECPGCGLGLSAPDVLCPSCGVGLRDSGCPECGWSPAKD